MDDVQLITRAQTGDQQAFAELVARQQAVLYRLCYRLTGNAAKAEELAHDTFVEAYLKLGQLREAERFVPWLRAIALNLYRMAWRGNRETAELREDIPAVTPADDALPVQVSHGLSRLSSNHRLALVLHYLDGLSYEEVATFLGVPIGTVMSRLHRGRKELKRLVEEMDEEEMTMVPDPAFARAVQMEIAVLLEHFQQDPTAVERLSVLLARSPERFALLIADTTNETMLEHLGVLLRRLGRPAIEVALNCALVGEPAVRERAIRVLQAFVTHLRQGAQGGPALMDMPPVPAFTLLDGLIRSTADEGVKADLLVSLLETDTDDPTNALIANLLMGYPDAALPRLLVRFWQGSPEEAGISVPVLAALARMGTRFVAVLLEAISSGDLQRQLLAVTGMEAFARSLYSRHGEAVSWNIRKAAKWVPIPPEHVDQVVVDDAIGRMAALLGDAREELRNRAIRALGLLQAGAYRQQLEQCARHAAASTRVAALRALAEIGDPASAPVFMAATTVEASAERLAAVEAIGRLQLADAEPALLARVEDTDRQVRKAAVTALGDIGGEEARAALQRLSREAERETARAAATILHTSPHFRRPLPGNPALQERRREVRTRLLGADVHPSTFISLHAAIAALPAIRPYREKELTRLIAQVCIDYSTTRRQLIMDHLMRREQGVYELTETGEAIWRVEQFIKERYLR